MNKLLNRLQREAREKFDNTYRNPKVLSGHVVRDSISINEVFKFQDTLIANTLKEASEEIGGLKQNEVFTQETATSLHQYGQVVDKKSEYNQALTEAQNLLTGDNK